MQVVPSVQKNSSPAQLIHTVEQLLYKKQTYGLITCLEHIAEDPESMQRLHHLCHRP